jgi:ribosome-associated toxin RatA of RatAB toxin-antitoxin module
MSAGVPLELGPMPASAEMRTEDERLVDAPLPRIFGLAADVERWPALLPHYRYVRFVDRRSDGGGVVDMSANRPFGLVQWPTWWQSRMAVYAPGGPRAPAIRYTHVAGVTRGMEVEWTFEERAGLTRVRIVHLWNGPAVPLAGGVAASLVIGPVFVQGIASRTLAGLADVAERTRLTGG